MQSLRRTAYEDGYPEPAGPARAGAPRGAGERRAGDGLDELAEELAARYRLPRHVLIYANYALRGRPAARAVRCRARTATAAPRIVYQGTLSLNGGHYDLRELFARDRGAGHLARRLSRPRVPEYRAIPGIRVHETLPARELLARLTGYDFGWAGFNSTLNGPHLDTALPNKLYEYLGCGLPVITLEHRALRRMLREEGVGIALDRVEDLAPALAAADAGALRARVAAARARFTVEHEIDRVAALYREVVDTVTTGALARS